MNESLFVSTVVIALVDFLKQLEGRDYHGAATIALAGLIGGLAGYFAIDGLNFTNGVIAGLGAAGIYRAAMAVSGR